MGVRVRRTRLARLVAGGLLVAGAFAALGGLWSLAGVLAAALACSEALVVQQCSRPACVLNRAIENTAGSLPLAPLRPTA